MSVQRMNIFIMKVKAMENATQTKNNRINKTQKELKSAATIPKIFLETQLSRQTRPISL